MDCYDGEVIHEGWIVKSPPQERFYGYPMIKKKWRRRWFVLRVGTLPAQYVLCYYTDQQQKKLKGAICLDECNQVDCDLKDSNGKYNYMFTIRMPQRMYFLAVDTAEEMNEWVRIVCNVCGLRTTTEDENIPVSLGSSQLTGSECTDVATNVTSQSSSAPSPYILMSECYSGSRVPPAQRHDNQNQTRGVFHSRTNSLLSPNTARKQRTRIQSSHFTNTFPRPRPLDCDDDVFMAAPSIAAPTPPRMRSSQETDEVTIASLRICSQTGPDMAAPPPNRPPKPLHLSSGTSSNPTSTAGSENYANASEFQELNVRDGDLDSTKAAPSVSRGLKPGRRISSGAVTIAACRSNGLQRTSPGPPVERALKPKSPVTATMPRLTQSSFSKLGGQPRPPTILPFQSSDNSTMQDDGDLSDESPHISTNDEQIYYYMPSVNISTSMGGKNPPLMIPADAFEHHHVSYVDLDLPWKEDTDHVVGVSRFNNIQVSGPGSDTDPDTIYKTIDVEKTDAFNKTKRDIESQRQKNDAQLKQN